jgi:hypothetical protein
MIIERGSTYWYRSKLAQAAAEWAEVDRDLRHSRNAFQACIDHVGRACLEQAIANLGDPARSSVRDVDHGDYTLVRALCDSALVSYARAFESDVNGRRACIDRERVAADTALGEIHEALKTARNKLVAHPASGLEGSDCEIELRPDGALRTDFRTRNALIPIDARVLLSAPDHINAVVERHLQPRIDEAALAVEQDFTKRCRLVAGSPHDVRFRGDDEHVLIEAHDDHLMVNPMANPKRRNEASRSYPPAMAG